MNMFCVYVFVSLFVSVSKFLCLYVFMGVFLFLLGWV